MPPYTFFFVRIYNLHMLYFIFPSHFLFNSTNFILGYCKKMDNVLP